MSTDSGKTWEIVDSGFTEDGIRSLAANGQYVFAGTKRALFRRPLSEMVSVYTRVLLQKKNNYSDFTFHIRGNHAVITFTLSRPDKVSIMVFTVSGHKVASLATPLLSAGAQSTVWDTRGVAPGYYSVRMKTGDVCRTRLVSVY